MLSVKELSIPVASQQVTGVQWTNSLFTRIFTGFQVLLHYSKETDSLLHYGTSEATVLLDIIYLKVDRQPKR